MAVLDDGRIVGAFNLNTDQFWSKVTNFLINQSCTIVIEDLAPYSLKLTPQVIDTAKWIGMAVERLTASVTTPIVLIPRSSVKKWVYEAFPEVVLPLCDKKIDKKLSLACDLTTRQEVRVDDNGKVARKSSFVYVDDKIVTEAMKYLHRIEMPKPGSGYEHGLKEHSWQSLAIASFYYCGLK
jgi:hypothetical protein